jgi:hypothetical protein
VGLFCPPGSGSGSRNSSYSNADPCGWIRIRIRIRNPGSSRGASGSTTPRRSSFSATEQYEVHSPFQPRKHPVQPLPDDHPYLPQNSMGSTLHFQSRNHVVQPLPDNHPYLQYTMKSTLRSSQGSIRFNYSQTIILIYYGKAWGPLSVPAKEASGSTTPR